VPRTELPEQLQQCSTRTRPFPGRCGCDASELKVRKRKSLTELDSLTHWAVQSTTRVTMRWALCLVGALWEVSADYDLDRQVSAGLHKIWIGKQSPSLVTRRMEEGSAVVSIYTCRCKHIDRAAQLVSGMGGITRSLNRHEFQSETEVLSEPRRRRYKIQAFIRQTRRSTDSINSKEISLTRRPRCIFRCPY
jgi:hypothetical protein